MSKPTADPGDIMDEASVAEITRLMMRYCEFQDAADFDRVGELFEQGAYIIDGVSESYIGSQAIAAMKKKYDRTYADGTLRTKHVTTNAVIEIDEGGDTAHARSYFVVYQQLPDLPLQAIIAGRYHDRFVRSGSTWGFAERRVLSDLIGNMTGHTVDSPLDRALAQRVADEQKEVQPHGRRG